MSHQITNNFCLDLKVKGKMHKLPINMSDTRQSILEKLNLIYPDCHLHEQLLLRKIEQEMILLSKHSKISNSLKKALQLSWNKIFVNPQESTILGISQQAERPSKTKTCADQYLIITAKNNKSKATQTQPGQNQVQLNNILSGCDNQLETKDIDMSKLSQITIKTINNKESISQSHKKNNKTLATKKKSCNPDIIKACQTIMKKHNQKDMKSMAKQFLKQKGYLPQQKQQVKRQQKVVTQISQPSQKLQTSSSQSLPKRRQSCSISNYNYISQPYRERRQTSYSLFRYNYLGPEKQILKVQYQYKPVEKYDTFKSTEPVVNKKYKYLID